VLINLKLQPPPPAYPRHWTVHPAQGAGNLNVALEGWGIWTGFIRCSYVIRPCFFFGFLQGVTDLQDRISPLLVNNSFKRVFKWGLKVSLQHISLWKVCKVFDWRRNLCMRRGSSVLRVGYLNSFFAPRGGNMNKPIFKSSNVRGGGGGGDLLGV